VHLYVCVRGYTKYWLDKPVIDGDTNGSSVLKFLTCSHSVVSFVTLLGLSFSPVCLFHLYINLHLHLPISLSLSLSAWPASALKASHSVGSIPCCSELVIVHFPEKTIRLFRTEEFHVSSGKSFNCHVNATISCCNSLFRHSPINTTFSIVLTAQLPHLYSTIAKLQKILVS